MNKGDDSFKDFVLDQLQQLDDVEARRMFGGYGLYRDETFFGILHQGKLYFKIDEFTVGEYRKSRMKPFRPNIKQTLVSWNQSSHYNSNVIPGKLAIASATRNPGFSKIFWMPFSPA